MGMKNKIEYTFWQENDEKYLGYLNQYPDHWTQGETLEDLQEHLKDLYQEFSQNIIPGIKQVALLEV
jgi:predicted RNase H-like HicB family nuclease